MYCIAAGKGRPWAQEENSCGPHRADGPTGDLGKKKKNHARLMAQNSRASLDLKGTRQMGITPISWVLVKITLVLVKISVDK